MKNLQKIIATGALIGFSLIAGCKDSSKERAKAEMDATREQRMLEYKLGIITKDHPELREIILKKAEKIEEYGDSYTGAYGKKVTYGDDLTGEWCVAYFPEN